jgi:hypothetical protein
VLCGEEEEFQNNLNQIKAQEEELIKGMTLLKAYLDDLSKALLGPAHSNVGV